MPSTIAKKLIELSLGFLLGVSGLGAARRFERRIPEAEVRAEVRPVFFPDRLVDRFAAVPVRAGTVEAAIQADLQVLLA